MKEFDYSSQACYFVTILTNNRAELFWQGKTISELGRIVEKHILLIPESYFGVKVDNYSITPDHIHLLITIGCDALPDDEETMINNSKGMYKFKNISTIIGSFKSTVTKDVRKVQPDISVWHRSYYDHIIRNMNDYNETWDYIENNPNVYLAKIENKRDG